MLPIDPLKAPLTGTNLIEASAGTGKTHTIASLFLRLILEKKMPVEEILVVTFTKAAASELKERIRNRLSEAREAFLKESEPKRSEPKKSEPKKSEPDEFLDALTLKYDSLSSLRIIEDALANFDLASIFTIHGFCQKILYENAFETGALFNTELVTEKTALFQEVADDFWRKNFYNSQPEITAWALKKLKGPEFFLKFLRKLKSPHIKIIPDIKKPHITGLPLYREELKKVYTGWPLVRHEIEALLSSPSLKAGTYKKSKVLPMLESMERFVAGGSGFPLFKGFQNFTSSKLEKFRKNGMPGVFHPFFDICDKLWNLSISLEIQMEQYFICIKSEFFKFAKNELTEKKEAANINFFDDLLIKVNNAVKGEGGDSLAKAIRQKYQAALVDEFQDTDLIQYEIFSKLFSPKDKTIFMIGDPKQAIYGFRGADIFSYIKASEDADNRFTLKKNWRSDPGLITAVNTIFSNVSNPFIFKEIPFICSDAAKKEDFSTSAPFNLWYLPAEEEKSVNKPVAVQLISNAVAKEIDNLISISSPDSEIKFKPGNIAVLVRTNAQAQIIKDSLVLKNIPSVLYNADNIFDSHEAEEVHRILAGIGEPDNENMLRAALVTDMIGVSGEDLDISKDDSIWWNRWFSRFITYNRLWTGYGFIRMFKSFISMEKVKKRILSYYDGERRLTNILHLSEILQKESERHSGITGLLKWLSEKRSNAATENEEHQLRLESDEDSVKIVTIHKSKGMEYDVIFSPFGWDGSIINDKEFLFHENNKAKRLVFDIGSDERKKNLCLAKNELLAENIRLLYVALTRAKKKCYMAWGKINKSETSSMAYILHNRDLSFNSLNEDITDKLKKQLSSKTDENLIDDLKDIAARSSGTIKFSLLPLYNGSAREKNAYKKEEDKKKYLKKFTEKIDTSWKISSYSSIISGSSTNKHDAAEKKPSEISDKNDIFSFPAGAHAGIFFHDIFEHLDFTTKDSEKIDILVKNRLNEYGFDPAWDKTVVRMVKNVISTRLFPESYDKDLRLSCIETKDRVNEMEFYFPLNRINPEKLENIFISHFKSCTGIPTSFSEQMGRLNFSTTRGFMKGFIDLIFFYENRFYIVDWKSNLLGRIIEDYNQETLVLTMNEELYFLQYHLYTLAVHQYLKNRIPDYNYEKNFGGVFYIFIRGVNPDRGPLFGIYRDMPKIDLIDRMEQALIP